MDDDDALFPQAWRREQRILLNRIERLNCCVVVLASLMALLQLTTFLGIGIAVWSQYGDVLKPMWNTTLRVYGVVDTLLPAVEQYAPKVETLLGNVTQQWPQYSAQYETAVTQVSTIYDTVQTAEAVAWPYVVEVVKQYEQCEPFFQNVCSHTNSPVSATS